MIQPQNVAALAPIALFAFKRPEHTRRTLESLAQNPEFADSPLFVYCDGARNDAEAAAVEQTRQLVRDWPHPKKTVIERDVNWGLARSVMAGVSDLCERFGRVIVVEDDLVLSPVFLHYLNSALDRYEDQPAVMQVSGYMFPVSPANCCDAAFLPITSTWGWATWQRSWQQFDFSAEKIARVLGDSTVRHRFNLDGAYPYSRRLKSQLAGESDSWGIQWYLSVFSCDGLVVYPPESLVDNIGHDGSGTHCLVESTGVGQGSALSVRKPVLPANAVLSREVFQQVKTYLRKNNGFWHRAFLRVKTEVLRRFRRLVG